MKPTLSAHINSLLMLQDRPSLHSATISLALSVPKHNANRFVPMQANRLSALHLPQSLQSSALESVVQPPKTEQ